MEFVKSILSMLPKPQFDATEYRKEVVKLFNTDKRTQLRNEIESWDNIYGEDSKYYATIQASKVLLKYSLGDSITYKPDMDYGLGGAGPLPYCPPLCKGTIQKALDGDKIHFECGIDEVLKAGWDVGCEVQPDGSIKRVTKPSYPRSHYEVWESDIVTV